MIKCIHDDKTYDAEDTRFAYLLSTEAPTGKTTGEGIDDLPDSVTLADGSYCKDLAHDKKYQLLGGTWYETDKKQ